MIDADTDVMPQAWIDSMRSDANAELSVARSLYDSAVQDMRDRLSDDLDKVASVYRDAVAVMQGDNTHDLAMADAAMTSVSNRLRAANQRDLSVAYSALTDLGGTPPFLTNYVNAALDRGSGAQDAIDNLYAPRGQLTDMASPVDPFTLSAQSTAGMITATARIDLSSLIPTAPAPEATPCPAPSSYASPISVSISPPPPPPLVLVPGSPVPTPPPPPPPPIYVGGSPTTITTDIGDAYTTTAVPPPPLPPPPPVVSIITIPTPVPTPVPPTPEARAATAAYVTRADAPIAPHAGTSWADPDKCRLLAAVAGLAPDRPDLAAGVDTVLRGIVGAMADASASLGLFGGTISIANTVVSQIANVLPMVVTTLGSLTNLASVDSPPIAIASLEAIGITGWLDRITGSNFGYLSQGVLYDLQWSAPQYIPGQGELDTLLLHKWIDKGAWTCYTRALGNIPELRDAIIYDSHVKPGVNEEVLLENRGFSAPADTDAALSHLGVVDDRAKAAFRELAKFVPATQDLVRFMVRDAFDPQAIKLGQLDKDFADKFLNSPDALRIAKANGVTSEDMLRFWTSHWNQPSAYQIAEGLHRLRPGRTPDGVEPVTLDVARETLEIDDMAPAWVPRILANSYSVIPRHDVQQWYTDGIIADQEAIERLQDCGYNLADSTRMVDAWKWHRAEARASRDHGWTRDKILSEYKGGALQKSQALLLLSDLNADPQESVDALVAADGLRRVEAVNECISAVKSRYFRGEFEAAGATQLLTLMGLDGEQVDAIVQGWTCELFGRAKQPTLMLLRKWYHRGIIDADELHERLTNLRYSDDDATKIVTEMTLTEIESQNKRIEAAAKAALTAKNKNDAARDKSAKAAQAAMDKAAAAEQRKVDKAAAARKKYDDAVAKAEGKIESAEEAAAKAEAKAEAAQAKAVQREEAKREKAQSKLDAASVPDAATTPLDTTSGDAQPSTPTGTDGANASQGTA